MTAEEIQKFRDEHSQMVSTEFHFINPPMKAGNFLVPDDIELKKLNKYMIIEKSNKQTVINGDLLISLIASYETT